MRTLLLTAFLLIGVHALAQFTPSTVPDPKENGGGYVSNPRSILNESTVAEINSLLADLEQQTTAQVAVVVLDSIGDSDIVVFSQELFTLWGPGRSNDNGLLILFALDKRTVRFHTGYKLEGPLPDVVCKQIQRNKMVPAFKEGDYDTGMLAGVQEVYKILTDPNYSIEITEVESDNEVSGYTAFVTFTLFFMTPFFLITWAVKSKRFADSTPPAKTAYPQMRLKKKVWLWEFGGIPLLIILLFWFMPSEFAGFYSGMTIYFYYMATLIHRLVRERKMLKGFVEQGKYFEATDYLRQSQWYWFFMLFVFPVPVIGYLPFHFIRKRLYRNHARNCKLCDKEMVKLNEIEDDQHLTKNQQLEETIRSIDYDIWSCTGCGAVESWTFRNRFSKYKVCPACKTAAYYKAGDRTLVSPTYSSSGKGEETHNCKACGKSYTKTYAIAKRTSSSSGGSSSGGGGSSSSSSGSSWGGGRSGGGGSSSSW